MIRDIFLDLDKKINIDIDEINHDYFLSIDNPSVRVFISNNISVFFEANEIDIYICKEPIISISYNGVIINKSPITAFEVKMICTSQESPILTRKGFYNYSLTDLHTHFTASPRGKTLIRLGLKHNIEYPVKYLKEIGIAINNKSESVPLTSLSDNQLEQLRFALSITANTITIFNKLERIYNYREPFTKNILLFSDLLEEIALDYSRSKVRYVEISQSLFYSDPLFLKEAQRCLPEIERKYHVIIRFLCAIRRNDTLDRSLDRIDIIRKLMESKYIVGIDFLGHETNSVSDFKKVLKEAYLLSMNSSKYFVVRVHAGETPVFINNINMALKYATHLYEIESKKHCINRPLVRIGHGLFGSNAETMKLAAKIDAIVEFNITSNLSLNNIRSLKDIPIKTYADNNVKFVIGTDGSAVYRTNSRSELLLAYNSGLEKEDFKKLKQLELDIIEKATSYCKDIDVDNIYKSIKYYTKNGTKRFDEKVKKTQQLLNVKHIQSLENRLKQIGASDNLGILNNKHPILICGSSRVHWCKTPKHTKEKIKKFVNSFLINLDCDNYYLVTGGTNYGVEKVFHDAAYANRKMGRNIEVLGTLVSEAKTSEINKNTITRYVILKDDSAFEQDWYGLANDLLIKIKEKGGFVIAIGGGNIVNDIIQTSYNIDLPIFLMNGVGGASSKKSSFFNENVASFSDISLFQNALKKAKKDVFTDNDYLIVDIDDYVRKHNKDVVNAFKRGYIKVRKAVEGEKVDTYTSGILESSNICKSGDFIATQLNNNLDVFLYKGIPNEWVISQEKLEECYILYKENIYMSKPIMRKLIRVNRNISFMAAFGKMLLNKDGYLEISNPNNIYGIQKDDFERTYVLCDDGQ